jgi:hypothetical protein
MSIRYIIAAALMTSACVAHADVLPGSQALGGASLIGSVNRGEGSDALVQALFDKVSANVGSNMKVSLKQGVDGVYVAGVSTAEALALAGDGMSVVKTADGFKFEPAANTNNGGAGTGAPSTGAPSTGSPGASNGAPSTPGANGGSETGSAGNSGSGNDSGSKGETGIGDIIGIGGDAGAGNGSGSGDLGNQAGDAAAVPEPSTVALMLAGMLGAVGLGRRRAR